MSLPKRNSADGRCYWMKPEVQEELQPLFDQCIQDAIDGRITRLDSLWPPVVVSSEGAPFEVWQLLRTWTEAQRAETLDAEKAIAFSENLRRQSRWGEIDHHLLDMLQRELQEKYFIVTGNEDDHFWDREYSLKPGIRAEQVPEPLLRFACYVAVSYKVYGMDFQYLDANYLFGLVEKVRPDMVKKLKEHGTGRLPLNLQKRKTEHFTASANDAFAVIRITARNSTEECCHEVLNYLCELLEQEDFPRSYAVEFKGPEKRYLPITGLPKKGVNQLFACAVQYPGLHPLMERYARLAMRQYEQYTNLSDEQCALPGSFAVFALGMLGQEWQQLVWDYYGLRRSEVLGLRWSAIDMEHKTISIRHKVIEAEVDGKFVPMGEDVLKTKSSFRTLPLIPAVGIILLEEKEKQEMYRRLFKKSYCRDYLDYICVDQCGKLLRPNYATEHFPWLIEKYGLRKVRFHDLRHTCASLLLSNGISMKQIQIWLRHSTFSTTADIYAHLDYSAQEASANAMNGMFNRPEKEEQLA